VVPQLCTVLVVGPAVMPHTPLWSGRAGAPNQRPEAAFLPGLVDDFLDVLRAVVLPKGAQLRKLRKQAAAQAAPGAEGEGKPGGPGTAAAEPSSGVLALCRGFRARHATRQATLCGMLWGELYAARVPRLACLRDVPAFSMR